MTKFRRLSLQLKSFFVKYKFSEEIIPKESPHERTRSSQTSMDFDMIDPVLILKQKRLQNVAFVLEPELQELVSLCNENLSHKNITDILSYIQVDLQRFYLNPSHDKTVTSILCKYLFGYFRNDPYRIMYRVFSSMKVALQSDALHLFSPLRNAVSAEISNYDLLKKTQMDKLEYLRLIANEQKKVTPRDNSNRWIFNVLNKLTTLKAFHSDNHMIMDQETLALIMRKCPKLNTLECNVNFRNRNSGITMIPTIILGDIMAEIPFVEDHRDSDDEDDTSTFDTDLSTTMTDITQCSSVRISQFSHDFLDTIKTSNLTSVNFRCDVMNDEIMKQILSNRKLRSLKVTAQFVTRGNNVLTVDSLSALPQLRDLTTLDLVNISQLGMEECSLITQVPSLRNLRLVNCQLSNECVQIVLKPELETLDVSMNTTLTADAFSNLSKSKLISLTMLGVPVNKEMLYHISCSKINHLSASGGFFSDNELKELIDVNMPKTLSHLELEGVNQITNSGLRFLKDDATSLTHLSLTIGDNITHRGIQFIAEHPNMRILNLRKTYSSVQISGFEQLLTSDKLEELYLNNIPINSQDLQFLRSSNTSLKCLSIPSCELDEADAERVLQYYKNLRKLAVAIPSDMTSQEWSLKIGVFIGQYATLFEELDVYGDMSVQGAWLKVLFHTVATLQSVAVHGPSDQYL
jgi:hypothetical protein